MCVCMYMYVCAREYILIPYFLIWKYKPTIRMYIAFNKDNIKILNRISAKGIAYD